MRIKPGFELRDVCGEKVIIAQGVENIDFSKIINLNETAAFLWEKALDHDFTTAELAEALCEEYDVDKEKAFSDVNALVEEWIKQGLATK